MNIIIIISDTLRYDHVGAHGNTWIKTPNMDRLAAESWVFDRNFAASYATIPHRTDVMTGRYGGPFHAWMPLRYDVMTLPRVLTDAGYCAQLINDTPHLINGGHNFDWPFNAWTFIRGAEVDRPWIDSATEWPENWKPDPLFDFIDDSVLQHRMLATYARSNRKRKRDEDWNAAKLFLTASQWLRENASRDNFFLWVDCFDPHEPWDVPPEFAKMYVDSPGYDGRIDPREIGGRRHENMPEEAQRRIRAHYAGKVSWVDRWLGELLETLDDTGLSKNTAVIFTSDHGTNLYERGKFGKGYPVREQEGHTPFFVRTPNGGSGRSNIIVQPQDIFATVLGAVGVNMPEGIESYDVLGIAREGKDGPRSLAIAGHRADRWHSHLNETLFTVFDREWCLEVAAKPENSVLTKLGSLADESDSNPSIVETLRDTGINELERRGADPALVSWLRSQGETEFPKECRFWDGWPGPAAFAPYFAKRLYAE